MRSGVAGERGASGSVRVCVKLGVVAVLDVGVVVGGMVAVAGVVDETGGVNAELFLRGGGGNTCPLTLAQCDGGRGSGCGCGCG